MTAKRVNANEFGSRGKGEEGHTRQVKGNHVCMNFREDKLKNLKNANTNANTNTNKHIIVSYANTNSPHGSFSDENVDGILRGTRFARTLDIHMSERKHTHGEETTERD